jgi:hypothetical protein
MAKEVGEAAHTLLVQSFLIRDDFARFSGLTNVWVDASTCPALPLSVPSYTGRRLPLPLKCQPAWEGEEKGASPSRPW